jgi:hypothetical protein
MHLSLLYHTEALSVKGSRQSRQYLQSLIAFLAVRFALSFAAVAANALASFSPISARKAKSVSRFWCVALSPLAARALLFLHYNPLVKGQDKRSAPLTSGLP